MPASFQNMEHHRNEVFRECPCYKERIARKIVPAKMKYMGNNYEEDGPKNSRLANPSNEQGLVRTPASRAMRAKASMRP